MDPVIELAGLSVRLGKRESPHMLQVALSGPTIGPLGPKGGGKSTLTKPLLGFVPTSGGSARILGLDFQKAAAKLRSLIGYMRENVSFIAGMTAVSFVRM